MVPLTKVHSIKQSKRIFIVAYAASRWEAHGSMRLGRLFMLTVHMVSHRNVEMLCRSTVTLCVLWYCAGVLCICIPCIKWFNVKGLCYVKSNRCPTPDDEYTSSLSLPKLMAGWVGGQLMGGIMEYVMLGQYDAWPAVVFYPQSITAI